MDDLAGLPREHGAGGRLSREEGAPAVHVHHVVPVVGCGLQDRLAALHAGGVEHDVEATIRFDRAGNHPLDGVQVADVRRDHERLSPEAANRLGYPFEVGLGTGGEDHIGPSLGEGLGQPCTDTGTGAGDEGHPAIEPKLIGNAAAAA